ncbi:elongation of very long chain fatty acids protein [Tribolium madens]|uniref:elongation of very long chain fatty acids protein n=1 Tax=Tribolium madens TaxID=41895 RepID=UPI001CF71FDD|nr:elongation of very long chain fatty acids protein [Tribolium madens]
MANSTVDNTFKRVYHFLFTELGDPRTNNWFLVTHPVIFPIVGFYLYFVTKLGPRLMKDRPPFEFKLILVLYNAFQVVLSTWLFWEALEGAFWDKYSWKCEPVDFSWSPHALRVARGVYIFYLAKISELLDTVFFVLRKKNNQVSFLHLYHHAVMPMISWGVVKYMPGGHAIFIGFINSFVHIIMYTYYLLAAMGPQFQKYLWWKKHITNLQMIQFCVAFLHSSQLLFYDCGYPRWSVFFTLPNAVFFYYLFDNFYKQSYKYGKRIEKNEKSNGIQNGYHIKTQ